MVVAETAAAAADAAERVVVDYEAASRGGGGPDAPRPDAPLLWEEHGTNVCVDSHAGDARRPMRRSRAPPTSSACETWVPRVTGVPMEPRAAVGAYDAASGRYTVHAGAGRRGAPEAELAGALGVPESDVRVVSGDVGGNFGTRNSCYPEFVLVAWAARRLGRPVKWTCERREAFLTDYHGRDLTSQAELALDARRHASSPCAA